ncbi:5-formyltetrahydrofolate cyclo-ligase [Histidinibacterium aquaticum]|uniref:5-formyltetrahydrofolate cyclo-ligase n=1 Tax=Histidinibacterium aquaticum TaxID=2613962 RepID=A0A5J5GBZ2_9RHOB|nr:5-formyltetrahydrofolate cyclo-ligase [Histidinibacterium aquaticum]KAA9005675.1 5-formyltetrahydrofolate cyclo-ligase [Histidinibacterium aquaticum]
MTPLDDAKALARKSAYGRRKTAHEAGAGPGPHLSSILAEHRGVPLAGYMPIRTEIDVLPAMTEAAAHGPVGVPVIVGQGLPLMFHEWTPGCQMMDGPFGACIPVTALPMVPQVVIVPLVAFDRRGGRLGYGGGFYDRTLERLRSAGPCLAIGYAYSAQEDDALPLEETDQPLDMIVTETEVIDLR